MSPSPFRRARWFYAYVGFAIAVALASFLIGELGTRGITTALRILPLVLIWAFDIVETGQAGLRPSQRRLIKRALLPPSAGLAFLAAGALVLLAKVAGWPWWPAAIAIVAAALYTVRAGPAYDDKVGARYDWKVPDPVPVAAPPPTDTA